MELHNKTNFGQLVHHLHLHAHSFSVDANIFSAFPTVFPNVRNLTLLGMIDRDVGVNTPGLQMRAKAWRKVESIVELTYSVDTTLQLLDCLMFDGLRNLELNNFVISYATPNQRMEQAQIFINVIHNAPSLKKLSFSDAALKIADLEDLHASTTKLKRLHFRHIEFYTDDIVENQASYQPTKSLESFSLKNILPSPSIGEEESQTLDGATENWILYIGQKYPLLKKLDLIWDGRYIPDTETTTRFLAIALRNLTRLKPF